MKGLACSYLPVTALCFWTMSTYRSKYRRKCHLMVSQKHVVGSRSGVSKLSIMSQTPMRMVSCVIFRLYFFEI